MVQANVIAWRGWVVALVVVHIPKKMTIVGYFCDTIMHVCAVNYSPVEKNIKT